MLILIGRRATLTVIISLVILLSTALGLLIPRLPLHAWDFHWLRSHPPAYMGRVCEGRLTIVLYTLDDQGFTLLSESTVPIRTVTSEYNPCPSQAIWLQVNPHGGEFLVPTERWIVSTASH
jgi:hypothetical protein